MSVSEPDGFPCWVVFLRSEQPVIRVCLEWRASMDCRGVRVLESVLRAWKHVAS